MRRALPLFLTVVLVCAFVSGCSAETKEAAVQTETVLSVDAEEETWTYWENLPMPDITELELYSRSLYVAYADTGEVIYSLNEETSVVPASTIKLLTCLIALENCSLDETVTFTETALDLNSSDSNIGAAIGEQMSLEDALYGMMLPSGCDCANAVAEHVAGSIDAFVEMMNAKAAALGCTGTYFSNPSGINDWDNYTTAADMFLIAAACFANEELVEIVSTYSYTIEATNMSEARELTNSNFLIEEDSEYYDSRVIGGKTGMTIEAYRCLVVLAEIRGREIICVLYDCPNRWGVFPDVITILDTL